MAAKQSTGNVDAKGAGVHSLRHDEPDGCGVGVPHELRPPLLQGEGGVAVGTRKMPVLPVRRQDGNVPS